MAEIQAVAQAAQGVGSIYRGAAERRATRAEGHALEQAASIEAAGLKNRANEERAAASMAARERRRASEQVIGRQVALAADSGAGASDGTILDIIGETAERGELQAQTEMYKGEQVARGLEDKGRFSVWQASTKSQALRQKGDAAFVGSIFEGTGKIGEGVYKYGDRQGWWTKSDKPDSDETDPRTGWRTRVYRAKR